MMNVFAAAWQLTCYQLLSKKRLWLTAIFFLLPIVIAVAIRNAGRINLELTYPRMLGGVLASVLIPFVALFWGTALLTDEIEGKTLVYLWTRPKGRGMLFAARALMLGIWLAILSFVAAASAYTGIFLGQRDFDFASNFLMVLWDTRALALGAATYAAAGLLLAALFKRPFVIGLIYVYALDGAAQFLPGFLKKLSVRHQMLSLATHAETARPRGILKLLDQSNTPETEAILTLVIVACVMTAIGIYILLNREFLGDDPARTQ